MLYIFVTLHHVAQMGRDEGEGCWGVCEVQREGAEEPAHPRRQLRRRLRAPLQEEDPPRADPHLRRGHGHRVLLRRRNGLRVTDTPQDRSQPTTHG